MYKEKGDALSRGKYRGLKLIDQVMNVMERVAEQLIRKQVRIDDMQFGFSSGKTTTDAIFIVRQLQEKHRFRKLKLVLTNWSLLPSFATWETT